VTGAWAGIFAGAQHIPGMAATVDTISGFRWSIPRKRSWNGPNFAGLSTAGCLPMAMTAHVVFSALDLAIRATTSATIVKQVIRGVIGFQGC